METTEQKQQTKLLIPRSVVSNLPAMVRNELAVLPAQRQEEFLEDYKRQTKSTGKAYLLILILSMHYGYLRKWGVQVAFWFTFGGIGIWWLIDLFRISKLVDNYNKDVATDVMRNLKAISN